MGKSLSKEDLQYLLEKTCFTETQIRQWYNGFVVSSIHQLRFEVTTAGGTKCKLAKLDICKIQLVCFNGLILDCV